jgi:hypothetical protein
MSGGSPQVPSPRDSGERDRERGPPAGLLILSFSSPSEEKGPGSALRWLGRLQREQIRAGGGLVDGLHELLLRLRDARQQHLDAA